jgi:WD40 repeat protein
MVFMPASNGYLKDYLKALTRSSYRAFELDLFYWNVNICRAADTFVHDDEVASVSPMPNGRRAVSASRDRSPKVWDVEKGQLLGTWLGDHAMETCGMGVTSRLVGSGDRTDGIHILRLRAR